jgi:hypothetical protein
MFLLKIAGRESYFQEMRLSHDENIILKRRAYSGQVVEVGWVVL